MCICLILALLKATWTCRDISPSVWKLPAASVDRSPSALLSRCQGKQLIPSSHAGRLWLKPEVGNSVVGCCFLEQQGQQSFSQLFAGSNDYQSCDREMERTHLIEPGRRPQGLCKIIMYWKMKPTTEHRSQRKAWAPWFSNFIFLIQKPWCQQSFTWNCLKQIFWLKWRWGWVLTPILICFFSSWS